MTTAQKFQTNRYVIARKVIQPELASIIAHYTLIDYAQNYEVEPEGDLTKDQHSKYADPLMEAMMFKLHPIVENITQLQLLPTYSYYRLYKPGAILPHHKDRSACEISLSINFGYFYENVSKDYTWPLVIENVPIHLTPGDLVIYHGIELEHWRDEFIAGPNSWQSQAFLHYVNANGPHAEWAFDKRKVISTNY